MKAQQSCFIGFEQEFEESKAVLFGAPFDGTTSFKPGARFASSAMREDSWAIESYSPYFDKDLEDLNLFDYGDLELPFGDKKTALRIIQEHVQQIIDANKIPIMIGGEHLVSLAPVKALSKKYDDLNIIHFDAHTDLRKDYLGEALSHATVLRRIYDQVGDNKVNQFCIRSGLKEEFEWAKEHTHLEKFTYKTLPDCVKRLENKPVYITIDLDVLDPSVFPGTGTPEPGGIDFHEMLDIINILSKLNNVVGMDVVELSPKFDASGVSTAVACKTLRELVLATIKN
ncbi:agmatinase [Malaciobacter molluscorum LMG 25693]|uniref:Agmatinase n=1 Tax=Malaciobacter molluscorum LMG 25693 TaxID=870501 RepID=A0A2G1DLI4_9BACT|nr:agmatinase [Malaciobacter molluscorum]AXX92102.1 arginase/agmatinase/formiminoglutamate hydrolase, arginase family [Malaciobacter molluscorum LMG 25693]PHO19330.1 agmatinase [Malaciobacter molluscorum LMG 25693]RXJ96409.1 agmatinase [Malaciobacter molluscorum]